MNNQQAVAACLHGLFLAYSEGLEWFRAMGADHKKIMVLRNLSSQSRIPAEDIIPFTLTMKIFTICTLCKLC